MVFKRAKVDPKGKLHNTLLFLWILKSLIAFFLFFHFFPFSFLLHFLKCCGKMRCHQFVSGGDLIVAIFKKEKKSRLKTYSSVNKCDSICCHRRLCQKQQICLHILLHHSRCALQVNIVQKIQVSVQFFYPSSCIDGPFDLIFLL